MSNNEIPTNSVLEDANRIKCILESLYTDQHASATLFSEGQTNPLVPELLSRLSRDQMDKIAAWSISFAQQHQEQRRNGDQVSFLPSAVMQQMTNETHFGDFMDMIKTIAGKADNDPVLANMLDSDEVTKPFTDIVDNLESVD